MIGPITELNEMSYRDLINSKEKTFRIGKDCYCKGDVPKRWLVFGAVGLGLWSFRVYRLRGVGFMVGMPKLTQEATSQDQADSRTHPCPKTQNLLSQDPLWQGDTCSTNNSHYRNPTSYSIGTWGPRNKV